MKLKRSTLRWIHGTICVALGLALAWNGRGAEGSEWQWFVWAKYAGSGLLIALGIDAYIRAASKGDSGRAALRRPLPEDVHVPDENP